MIDLYWGCLIGGIIFSLVSLFGLRAHHGAHGAHHLLRFHAARFLHPTTIVGGITAFGGAGVLLTKYASMPVPAALLLAIAVAVVMSILVHLLLVKPMSNSEASMGFSRQEYVGRTALVTIPIPAAGHGQVMVNMGAGNTCEPAASFDGEAIPSHSRVVVVEVKDHTLYVTVADH
jgi:membrane protein implicated in regulation of membrane protease activity